MSIWFSFSAVKPALAAEWGLDNTQAGLILGAFQFGYIAAAVGVGYLSDIFNDRKVMALSALLAAGLNLAFSLLATGLGSAIVLRFLVGAAIAGVYTPGIRVLSSWFMPQERGTAVGLFVGALVVGSASPYLLAALAVSYGWRALMYVTVVAALFAALLLWFAVPDPPNRQAPTTMRFNFGLLRDRPLLLMILGYTAHMWELYAMWGWIGPFATFALQGQGMEPMHAVALGGQIAFWSVAAGGLACTLAGFLSDRFGRTLTASGFLAVSTVCSLGFGFLQTAPGAVLLLVGLIYGFAIVGDSPVFSAAVTELAPPANIGAALGMQSVIGFGITVVSTALFGLVVDHLGWQAAFIMLGLGAALGPVAMLRLRGMDAAARLAGGRR